jgi:MFS family permease
LGRKDDKLQAVRKALVAIGLLFTTIVVPVLAIVLAVWFITCVVRGRLWPWWFWAGGIVVIILLQLLAKVVTRYAVRDE